MWFCAERPHVLGAWWAVRSAEGRTRGGGAAVALVRVRHMAGIPHFF